MAKQESDNNHRAERDLGDCLSTPLPMAGILILSSTNGCLIFSRKVLACFFMYKLSSCITHNMLSWVMFISLSLLLCNWGCCVNPTHQIILQFAVLCEPRMLGTSLTGWRMLCVVNKFMQLRIRLDRWEGTAWNVKFKPGVFPSIFGGCIFVGEDPRLLTGHLFPFDLCCF